MSQSGSNAIFAIEKHVTQTIIAIMIQVQSRYTLTSFIDLHRRRLKDGGNHLPGVGSHFTCAEKGCAYNQRNDDDGSVVGHGKPPIRF